MQCSQEGTRNPFRITEIELRGHNPNDSQGGRENHSNIRSRITEDDIQHIGFISDQISKDINRPERGPSTYRRK